VGVFAAFLGALQTIFLFQIWGKWTRFSLWLNFLATFRFGLAGFWHMRTVVPLHFSVVFVAVLAFPFSLRLSRANILMGWFQREQANAPRSASQ
jgi:hypothetical protein